MWNDIITALAQSKDAFQSVFAVIGSIVAILGLNTWRKQLTGKTEYELACRLLRAVYTVRDRVNALRSPFISAGEMYAAAAAKYREEEELNQALQKHDHLAELAYQVRWERVQEAISDLAVQGLEAEVLWEARLKSSLKEFYDCLTELRVALEDYLSMRHGDYGEVSDKDQLATKKIVLRGWGTRADKVDEFGERFSKAVKALSSSVRPCLDVR